MYEGLGFVMSLEQKQMMMMMMMMMKMMKMMKMMMMNCDCYYLKVVEAHLRVVEKECFLNHEKMSWRMMMIDEEIIKRGRWVILD